MYLKKKSFGLKGENNGRRLLSAFIGQFIPSGTGHREKKGAKWLVRHDTRPDFTMTRIAHYINTGSLFALFSPLEMDSTGAEAFIGP